MGSHLINLLRNPVLILGMLFLIIAAFIFTYIDHLISRQVESNTIQSAHQYSQVLTTFRTLYTSEVVTKAIDNKLIVSHDYQLIDNAIPLPATFSMLLGEKMGMQGFDVKASLYSPFPFPWRQSTGGLKDEFSRQAWDYLQDHQDQAFVRIENIHGEASVRYAVADVLRQSCVDCHNSHADTPRVGWQAGDVRGVLEISLPLKAGLLGAQQISTRIVVLVSLMLTATLVVLFFLIRRIESKHRQTLLLNADLSKEVMERQKAEQEAVLANKTKSLFLANISHEIRTPMNAILGYTQIIGRDKNLSDEQRQSLNIVANSGEHLLNLINDVLDISKIESGVLELHQSTFDIVALLQGISDMFRLKTSQKGLHWKLYLDFPFEHLMVSGDEGKLRQILINLIGNAIKFTDVGYVQLKAEVQADSHFAFAISDSGMGIDQQEITTLFTPFSQGSAGLIKGGTGLGLALSKRYLQLMGSELQVSSVKGEGTNIRFVLTLPIQQGRMEAADERVVKGISKGQQLSILVIDDNQINRDVLSKMLLNIGISVVTAEDGLQALTLLSQQKFELVFTDIDMPEMNGYRLMQEVIKTKLNASTPVVAVTASTLEQDKEHFSALGFSDYLGKPFLMKELYACIRQATGVEFDYEALPQAATHNSDTSQAILFPQADVVSSIKAAAELSLVSDIEDKLKTLQQTGQHAAFIERVKSYLSQYDMDGLIAFLDTDHE